MPSTIVIADDHAVVHSGLRMLLDSPPRRQPASARRLTIAAGFH
jgi:DNA-binding NarL/FixJ family response regulator